MNQETNLTPTIFRCTKCLRTFKREWGLRVHSTGWCGKTKRVGCKKCGRRLHTRYIESHRRQCKGTRMKRGPKPQLVPTGNGQSVILTEIAKKLANELEKHNQEVETARILLNEAIEKQQAFIRSLV